MNRLTTCMSILTALLFYVGAGRSLDSVQGVWKTEQPDVSGHHFLEVGRNHVLLDGKRLDNVSFEKQGGAVLLKAAQAGGDFGRLIINGKDRVTVQLAMVRGNFIRSNTDEMSAALNPSTIPASDFYRSDDGRLLRVSGKTVFLNGDTIGLELVSWEGGKLLAVDKSDNAEFILEPLPKGGFLYSTTSEPVPFHPISAKEGIQVLKAIGESAAAK